MWSLENEMLLSIYQRTLTPGIVAPQHEDEMLPLTAEQRYDPISKGLPSSPLMRSSLVRYYGECGIQEKYTLRTPWGEMPPDNL